MLLKPSYLELMSKLNEGSKEENKINNLYAVVVIVAKCARLQNGNAVKAISVAIEKLLAGKIKIMASSD